MNIYKRFTYGLISIHLFHYFRVLLIDVILYFLYFAQNTLKGIHIITWRELRYSEYNDTYIV